MSIENLERQFRRIGHLQHVSAIMQWDEAVMMPTAAGPERAAALSTLGVVIHEHLTAPQLEEWIAGADAEQQQASWTTVRARTCARSSGSCGVRAPCPRSSSKASRTRSCAASRLGGCSARTTTGKASRRCCARW